VDGRAAPVAVPAPGPKRGRAPDRRVSDSRRARFHRRAAPARGIGLGPGASGGVLGGPGEARAGRAGDGHVQGVRLGSSPAPGPRGGAAGGRCRGGGAAGGARRGGGDARAGEPVRGLHRRAGRRGRALDELYPRYRVPLALQQLEPERLEGIDAAIVAYPHAAAAPTVAALHARGARVVDLSADFRLRSLSTYQHWYGEHPCPELMSEAVYGLTELHREQIAGAAIVANPGCYPTAAVLGLAPLARAGLISDVVVDAKQGVSGAGRGAGEETTHLSMAGENILPYKVAAHRHTPEIEEQLGLLGAELRVQF